MCAIKSQRDNRARVSTGVLCRPEPRIQAAAPPPLPRRGPYALVGLGHTGCCTGFSWTSR
jgi:hypothetical protein